LDTHPAWPLRNQRKAVKSRYRVRARVSENTLRFAIWLQPTDVSQRYQVAVRYRWNHHAVVRVLRPKLVGREDGQAIPHRYSDGSLCLYNPTRHEWSAGDSLAATIVPWASLWLYFYEAWLLTGIWQGGGDHPRLKIPAAVLHDVRNKLKS